MFIRPAEPHDQSRLDALARALHPHLAHRSVTPIRQGARCFVACEQEGRIGFAIVSFIDYGLESSGYIDELIVDERFRGRGAGAKLIETCLDWLHENDVSVVFVSTLDDAAEAFYVSRGFSRCKRPWLMRPLAP